MKIACSLALLCGGTAADPSLRGAEAWPRQLQAAPSTTGPSEETVVPSCAAGYVDITGGSAYVWTCAFYCEGGPNFATDTCICACLTPDQIERLGLDLNASTTVPQVGDSDQILVTRKPVTEAPFSAPVEEAPVGELFDGPSRPTAAPAPAPYVVVGSDVSTTTVPDTGPVLIVETDWQIILLFLIGSFLIIVAVSMVLVFAHRNGFLGAVRVAKTKDLSIHVSDEPAKPEEVKDNRLTPDKLSALRRDSQLSNGSKMSASAVTALDHLQKLREAGDTSAAGAAQHHLDTLHMARTPSNASSNGSDRSLRRNSRAAPVATWTSSAGSGTGPEQLQVPQRSSKVSVGSGPSVVVIDAWPDGLQALRPPASKGSALSQDSGNARRPLSVRRSSAPDHLAVGRELSSRVPSKSSSGSAVEHARSEHAAPPQLAQDHDRPGSRRSSGTRCPPGENRNLQGRKAAHVRPSDLLA